MNDKEAAAMHRRNALAGALMVAGLREFILHLLLQIRSGAVIDTDRLAAIRAETIAYAKNAGLEGVSLDEESQILRNAVENLEKLIDGAIAITR